jgi:putative transposase
VVRGKCRQDHFLVGHQGLRQNWLSNTVFESYDVIVDAACNRWRKFTAEPDRITSIGIRDWAHVGQPS